MGIHQSYAVLGLGRYGMAVARELAENGAEVLAVDKDEELVNSASAFIPYSNCADFTDAETLRQLDIASFDVAILSMASSLEASVMAVMLCKELGVKTVIAKGASEMNCRILRRVGADKVVFPEHESGVRLAKGLLSAGFTDIIELSRDVSMLELEIRPDWVGKSLVELSLRRKYSINVIAVVKNSQISISVDPEKPLEAGTKLIVIANVDRLRRLLK